MAERSKKRRRWVWLLLLAGVFMPVEALVKPFWPLSAAERRLLGTWEAYVMPFYVTFYDDHTYRMWSDDPTDFTTGSWSLNGTSLGMRSHVSLWTTITSLVRRIAFHQSDFHYVLEVTGPDELEFRGVRLTQGGEHL